MSTSTTTTTTTQLDYTTEEIFAELDKTDNKVEAKLITNNAVEEQEQSNTVTSAETADGVVSSAPNKKSAKYPMIIQKPLELLLALLSLYLKVLFFVPNMLLKSCKIQIPHKSMLEYLESFLNTIDDAAYKAETLYENTTNSLKGELEKIKSRKGVTETTEFVSRKTAEAQKYAKNAKKFVQEKHETAKQYVNEKSTTAKKYINEKQANAKQYVDEKRTNTKDYVSSKKKQATEYIAQSKDSATDYIKQKKEKVFKSYEDQAEKINDEHAEAKEKLESAAGFFISMVMFCIFFPIKMMKTVFSKKKDIKEKTE